MNVYVIYKQSVDDSGNVLKVELVEVDMNEQNAVKFSKLYNLQVPHDMKRKVSFNYIGARVQ